MRRCLSSERREGAGFTTCLVIRLVGGGNRPARPLIGEGAGPEAKAARL